jgi:hypothetical protein
VGTTLEFGVVDKRLVIGSGDAVDRLAGTQQESLAGSDQYKAVMGTLPAEHNGIVYLDLTQLIPLAQMAEESAPMGMETQGAKDASPDCANYASQKEAQAAYDAAEPNTFDLDQNFNGVVCEDYFAASTESTGTVDQAAATPAAFANIDYSAIKAFASVSYEEDGKARSSSILYISK